MIVIGRTEFTSLQANSSAPQIPRVVFKKTIPDDLVYMSEAVRTLENAVLALLIRSLTQPGFEKRLISHPNTKIVSPRFSGRLSRDLPG